MDRDIVFCNGLELDVFIGFHAVELGVLQTVVVDLTMEADFRVGPERDDHRGLVDYYEIKKLLDARVAGRRYDLVEALAVDLANEVLRGSPCERVRVRVHKRPLDMKRVREVGVEVVRGANDLPKEPATP